MAAPAQQAKYAAKAKKFAQKLREKGEETMFLAEQASSLPGDSGELAEVGRAHVFPSEWQADFGGDVRSDDQMYFVSADVDVEACSKMRLGGKTYSIGKPVKKFAPASVTIYYEIRVNN